MNIRRTASHALSIPMVLFAAVAFAQQPASKPAPQDKPAAEAKSGNAVTDSWITMKIHSQFIPEDALEGSDIDVDTENGVVALKGTVPSEAARARAVAIAKATDGVKNVNSTLRVAATETARDAGRDAGRAVQGTAGKAGRAVTDGWIKSKVYSQYLTEDALEDSDIDLDVAKGAVTLNGVVRTPAGRARAEAIAKGTDGVTSVKNNLKVAAK